MERDAALSLLREHLKDDRMVKHCLAVEAIMRAAARRLGEEEGSGHREEDVREERGVNIM
ncbi:MAG: hypothetical protein QXJ38_05410 [Thermofilaceae archaeon]